MFQKIKSFYNHLPDRASNKTGVLENITASPKYIENLYQRLTRMSAADLSVLEAAVNEPGSHMITVFGSANDLLWNDMVSIGWLSKKIDTVDIPNEKSHSYPVYKIEPAGMQPLGELLERSLKNILHTQKMITIHDDLYPKIISQIVDPIREANGTPEDLVTITGSIVAYMIYSNIAPEYREEMLENLLHKAKYRLKQLIEN